MNCPICGRPLDADAKFCASCGKRVPRCPACGTVLSERSRFCSNDGTPLPEALFADFPPTGGVVTGPVSPPPSTPRPAPVQKPPRKKKKGRAAVVVLVILLLLAVAAAAAGGIYYATQYGLPSFDSITDVFSPKDKDRDDEDSSDREDNSSREDDSSREDKDIQKALAQADVHASVREYDQALSVIRDALEEHPRSRELKDAREEYEEAFVSALLVEANDLVLDGRPEDARDILDRGLALLPDNADLLEMLGSVEDAIAQSGAAAPVSMSGVISVTASSYLSEPNLNLYHTPERTVDGSLSTAWVEGIDGSGVGESISFTFDRTYLVSGMRINAGYQKSEELYWMNARPASLTVTFSDGTQQTVPLRDVNARQDITFGAPVETQSIRLTISSLYEGTTYADTVISEVSFY